MNSILKNRSNDGRCVAACNEAVVADAKKRNAVTGMSAECFCMVDHAKDNAFDHSFQMTGMGWDINPFPCD